MDRRLAASGIFLALVILTARVAAEPEKEPPASEKAQAPRVGAFSLADAAGIRHTQAEWKEHKAVVLFFLGTECPVANGYAPAMAELAKTFQPRGVACYGVHADPDVTALSAAKHAAEFGLRFPVLLDPRQVLAQQTGVRVAPEAVVLLPTGAICYRGRIDDRYALDGKRRDEPRTRDLEDALRAVLAGKKPRVAETKAFGCPLPAPAKP